MFWQSRKISATGGGREEEEEEVRWLWWLRNAVWGRNARNGEVVTLKLTGGDAGPTFRLKIPWPR
jgi:hypothetical protein